MPPLQVREFPADLYERLRLLSESEHRSIAQETIVAIESYLTSRAQPSNAGVSCLYSGTPSLTSRRPAYTEDIATADERAARIERRRQIFSNLDEFGGFALPDGYSNIEELVRDARDAR